ncbi:MAG: DUF423 domain-containing protein [Oceanobacter sp.]
MQARATLTLAALLGFLGVALGAFGAHGLKSVLEPAMMTVYQTGVQYHQIHAVALLVIGLWQLLRPTSPEHGSLKWAALFMLGGVLLFSGSLYTMAMSSVRMLGMITPIGGVSWLIGWALLARAGWQSADS